VLCSTVAILNNWNGSEHPLKWEQCWTNYTSKWCGGSTGVDVVVCVSILEHWNGLDSGASASMKGCMVCMVFYTGVSGHTSTCWRLE
jgi:hypothetical protein